MADPKHASAPEPARAVEHPDRNDPTATATRAARERAGRELDGSEYTVSELQAVYGDGLAGAVHLAGKRADVRLTRAEAEALLDAYAAHEPVD